MMQSPPGPSTSFQASNDDALATASSTLLNTGVTQANSLDPVLSQSLPPFPAALQQHILRDEYIEFNTLLPEVMFLVATSTLVSRSIAQSPRITSLST